MNAIVLLITVSSIIIILGIQRKRSKIKKNKQYSDDPYNNFHLGEMTRHDIPARFKQREKKYAKRYNKEAAKKKEEPKDAHK